MRINNNVSFKKILNLKYYIDKFILFPDINI